MTIKSMYSELSKLYPENLRAEWDNDGIMCCDDYNKTVNKILISLDITMEVVDYAVENQFDLIISHHPLVFTSQKSLTPDKHTQRKLIKLIKNGVSVFSFHTRLDAADGGVNDILCRILGLNSIQKDERDPVGRIGILNEPTELSTFAEKVKSLLNSPFVLYNGDKDVNKVYVVGGDGKDLIPNAIFLGADTLFTGRASYNTIIDAKDIGLNIIEAGHFFTENPICEKIKNDILSITPSVKTEIYTSFQLKNI